MSNDHPRRLGAYNRGPSFRQKERDGAYSKASYRPKDQRTELERLCDELLQRSKR